MPTKPGEWVALVFLACLAILIVAFTVKMVLVMFT